MENKIMNKSNQNHLSKIYLNDNDLIEIDKNKKSTVLVDCYSVLNKTHKSLTLFVITFLLSLLFAVTTVHAQGWQLGKAQYMYNLDKSGRVTADLPAIDCSKVYAVEPDKHQLLEFIDIKNSGMVKVLAETQYKTNVTLAIGPNHDNNTYTMGGYSLPITKGDLVFWSWSKDIDVFKAWLPGTNLVAWYPIRKNNFATNITGGEAWQKTGEIYQTPGPEAIFDARGGNSMRIVIVDPSKTAIEAGEKDFQSIRRLINSVPRSAPKVTITSAAVIAEDESSKLPPDSRIASDLVLDAKGNMYTISAAPDGRYNNMHPKFKQRYLIRIKRGVDGQPWKYRIIGKLKGANNRSAGNDLITGMSYLNGKIYYSGTDRMVYELNPMTLVEKRIGLISDGSYGSQIYSSDFASCQTAVLATGQLFDDEKPTVNGVHGLLPNNRVDIWKQNGSMLEKVGSQTSPSGRYSFMLDSNNATYYVQAYNPNRNGVALMQTSGYSEQTATGAKAYCNGIEMKNTAICQDQVKLKPDLDGKDGSTISLADFQQQAYYYAKIEMHNEEVIPIFQLGFNTKLLSTGDAPDGYHTKLANNGPYHYVGKLWLGEKSGQYQDDGQPSDDANSHGADDGIKVKLVGDADFTPLQDFVFVTGGKYQFQAKISANAGEISLAKPASLVGWLDWDQAGGITGAFNDSAGKKTIQPFSLAGAKPLVITQTGDVNSGDVLIPASKEANGSQTTYARFRLSDKPIYNAWGSGDENLSGTFGEVEDYRVFMLDSKLTVGAEFISAELPQTNVDFSVTNAKDTPNFPSNGQIIPSQFGTGKTNWATKPQVFANYAEETVIRADSVPQGWNIFYGSCSDVSGTSPVNLAVEFDAAQKTITIPANTLKPAAIVNCHYKISKSPVIRLNKQISARYTANDQFKLSINKQDGNEIATVVTKENETVATTGFVVAQNGASYVLDEKSQGNNSQFSQYESIYQCNLNGVASDNNKGRIFADNGIKKFELTNVKDGEAWDCTITNTILYPDPQLSKLLLITANADGTSKKLPADGVSKHILSASINQSADKPIQGITVNFSLVGNSDASIVTKDSDNNDVLNKIGSCMTDVKGSCNIEVVSNKSTEVDVTATVVNKEGVQTAITDSPKKIKFIQSLTMVKSVVDGSGNPIANKTALEVGQKIQYKFSFTNNSEQPITHLIFNDKVPAGIQVDLASIDGCTPDKSKITDAVFSCKIANSVAAQSSYELLVPAIVLDSAIGNKPNNIASYAKYPNKDTKVEQLIDTVPYVCNETSQIGCASDGRNADDVPPVTKGIVLSYVKQSIGEIKFVPGVEQIYKFTITNSGSGNATKVSFTDSFPAVFATVNDKAYDSTGKELAATCTVISNVLSCVDVPVSIAANGGTAEVYAKATMKADLKNELDANGKFIDSSATNKVKYTKDGTDPADPTNGCTSKPDNCDETPDINSPTEPGGSGIALNAVKSQTPAKQLSAGEEVTYTFSFTNSGTGDAKQVKFSDNLPAIIDLIALKANLPAGCMLEGSVLDCTRDLVVPADTKLANAVTTSFVVKVKADAAGDYKETLDKITNNASFSPNGKDESSDPITCPNTGNCTNPVAPIDPVIGEGEVSLSLVKNQTPSDKLAAGQQVKYSFTFTNASDAKANAKQVVFKDRLPEIIDLNSVVYSADAKCAITDINLVSCTQAGLNIEPGAEHIITITTKVKADAAGDYTASPEKITNIATFSPNGKGEPSDPNDCPKAGNCTNPVAPIDPVIAGGDVKLNVVKTQTPAKQLSAGAEVTYTFSFTNSGSADAKQVRFSDNLPVIINLVALKANLPTGCTLEGSVLDCTIDLVVPAGTELAKAVTTSFVAKVKADAAKDYKDDLNAITNIASFSENGTDKPVDPTTCPAAGADKCTNPVAPIDPVIAGGDIKLNVVKSQNPATQLTVDGEVTYTFSFTNSGSADAKQIRFSDNLPTVIDLIALKANLPAGCTLEGSVLDCTIDLVVPAGTELAKAVTTSFVAKVKANAAKDYKDDLNAITNIASFSENGTDKPVDPTTCPAAGADKCTNPIAPTNPIISPDNPSVGNDGKSSYSLTTGDKLADGVAKHTVTATVLDQYKNPIAGVEVEFTANPDAVIFVDEGKCKTDINGKCAVDITSKKADVYTITAKIAAGNIKVEGADKILFVPGDVDPTKGTTTIAKVDPNCDVSNGCKAKVTVVVVDKDDNPIPAKTVTVADPTDPTKTVTLTEDPAVPGTYIGEVPLPKQPGKTTVTPQIGDTPLSPATIDTSGDAPDLDKTTTDVTPTKACGKFTVNCQADVVVTPINKAGNPITGATVTVVDPTNPAKEVTLIEDPATPGVYKGKIDLPNKAGKLTITPKVNTVDVTPKTIVVVPGDVDPTKGTTTIAKVDPNCDVSNGCKAKVTVVVVDKDDNPIPAKTVTVADPTDPTKTVTLTEDPAVPGTYIGEVPLPKQPGKTTVTPQIGDTPLSPATIDTSGDAPDLDKTTTDVTPTKACGKFTVNCQADVVVTPINKAGNPITGATVTVVDPTNPAKEVTLIEDPATPGVYKGKIDLPNKAGDLTITPKVNTVDVTPKTIVVVPGDVDPTKGTTTIAKVDPNCDVSNGCKAKVTVVVVDKDDNPIPAKTVTVADPTDPTKTVTLTEDPAVPGTYIGEVPLPKQPGKTTVTPQIGDTPLSPATIDTSGDAPDLDKTTTDVTPTKECGKFTVNCQADVVVTPINKAGNPITGATVTVVDPTNPAKEVTLIEDPATPGVYKGKIDLPNKAGDLTITPKVNTVDVTPKTIVVVPGDVDPTKGTTTIAKVDPNCDVSNGCKAKVTVVVVDKDDNPIPAKTVTVADPTDPTKTVTLTEDPAVPGTYIGEVPLPKQPGKTTVTPQIGDTPLSPATIDTSGDAPDLDKTTTDVTPTKACGKFTVNCQADVVVTPINKAGNPITGATVTVVDPTDPAKEVPLTEDPATPGVYKGKIDLPNKAGKLTITPKVNTVDVTPKTIVVVPGDVDPTKGTTTIAKVDPNCDVSNGCKAKVTVVVVDKDDNPIPAKTVTVADPTDPTKTVTLTEDPAAPGTYIGEVPLPKQPGKTTVTPQIGDTPLSPATIDTSGDAPDLDKTTTDVTPTKACGKFTVNCQADVVVTPINKAGNPITGATVTVVDPTDPAKEVPLTEDPATPGVYKGKIDLPNKAGKLTITPKVNTVDVTPKTIVVVPGDVDPTKGTTTIAKVDPNCDVSNGCKAKVTVVVVDKDDNPIPAKTVTVADPTDPTKTVTLTEDPAAPGTYIGEVPLPKQPGKTTVTPQIGDTPLSPATIDTSGDAPDLDKTTTDVTPTKECGKFTVNCQADVVVTPINKAGNPITGATVTVVDPTNPAKEVTLIEDPATPGVYKGKIDLPNKAGKLTITPKVNTVDVTPATIAVVSGDVDPTKGTTTIAKVDPNCDVSNGCKAKVTVVVVDKDDNPIPAKTVTVADPTDPTKTVTLTEDPAVPGTYIGEVPLPKQPGKTTVTPQIGDTPLSPATIDTSGDAPDLDKTTTDVTPTKECGKFTVNCQADVVVTPINKAGNPITGATVTVVDPTNPAKEVTLIEDPATPGVYKGKIDLPNKAGDLTITPKVNTVDVTPKTIVVVPGDVDPTKGTTTIAKVDPNCDVSNGCKAKVTVVVVDKDDNPIPAKTVTVADPTDPTKTVTLTEDPAVPGTYIGEVPLPKQPGKTTVTPQIGDTPLSPATIDTSGDAPDLDKTTTDVTPTKECGKFTVNCQADVVVTPINKAGNPITGATVTVVDPTNPAKEVTLIEDPATPGVYKGKIDLPNKAGKLTITPKVNTVDVTPKTIVVVPGDVDPTKGTTTIAKVDPNCDVSNGCKAKVTVVVVDKDDNPIPAKTVTVADPTDPTKTVTLTEDPAAPGTYIGEVPLPKQPGKTTVTPQIGDTPLSPATIDTSGDAPDLDKTTTDVTPTKACGKFTVNCQADVVVTPINKAGNPITGATVTVVDPTNPAKEVTLIEDPATPGVYKGKIDLPNKAGKLTITPKVNTVDVTPKTIVVVPGDVDPTKGTTTIAKVDPNCDVSNGCKAKVTVVVVDKDDNPIPAKTVTVADPTDPTKTVTLTEDPAVPGTYIGEVPLPKQPGKTTVTPQIGDTPLSPATIDTSGDAPDLDKTTTDVTPTKACGKFTVNCQADVVVTPINKAGNPITGATVTVVDPTDPAKEVPLTEDPATPGVYKGKIDLPNKAGKLTITPKVNTVDVTPKTIVVVPGDVDPTKGTTTIAKVDPNCDVSNGCKAKVTVVVVDKDDNPIPAKTVTVADPTDPTKTVTLTEDPAVPGTYIGEVPLPKQPGKTTVTPQIGDTPLSPATIDTSGDAPDLDKTTTDVTPTKACGKFTVNCQADVVVTPINKAGNPITGATVTVVDPTNPAKEVTLIEDPATPGVYKGKIDLPNKAGKLTITPKVNTVDVTPKTIVVVPGDVDPTKGTTTIAKVDPNCDVSNGCKAKVTVVVVDKDDNPIPAKTVTVADPTDPTKTVTLTEDPAVPGTYIGEVPLPKQPGKTTVTPQIGDTPLSPATIDTSGDAPDLDKTTTDVTPTKACGKFTVNCQADVVVTPINKAGNPITGATVTVVDPTNPAKEVTLIEDPATPGVYKGKIDLPNKAGDLTITPKVNTVDVTPKTIVVVPGDVDPTKGTTTIAKVDPNCDVSNGCKAKVTVVVVDKDDNPIPAKTVTVADPTDPTKTVTLTEDPAVPGTYIGEVPLPKQPGKTTVTPQIGDTPLSPATIDTSGDAPDLDKTTTDVTPTKACGKFTVNCQADVVVTPINKAGNPITGATVTVVDPTNPAKEVTLIEDPATPGVYKGKIDLPNKAGKLTITPKVNTVDVTPATIAVVSGDVDEAQSEFTVISKGDKIANGIDYHTVKITLRDESGNLAPQATTEITTDDDANKVAITSCTTGLADTPEVGICEVNITSTLIGEFTVKVGNIPNKPTATDKVKFISGAVSSSQSVLEILTVGEKLANGIDSHQAKVVTRDAMGNTVGGAKVDFNVDSSGVTIPNQCTTDIQGICIVNITSTTGGAFKVHAKIDKVDIKNSPKTVIFKVADVELRVSKSAAVREAHIGDMVKYTITVENENKHAVTNFKLLDTASLGFVYVEDSAELKGGSAIAVTGYGPVMFTGLDIDAGKTLEISYFMMVGAGVKDGTNVNTVQAFKGENAISEALGAEKVQQAALVSSAGEEISNIASAEVEVLANDPIIDNSLLLGTVFDDANGNGVMDNGEQGLAGIRIATVEGLIIETDAYGRFHLEGINGGNRIRGRNFIMKIDESSLPAGSQLTTANPLKRRITPGIPVRFDFGVKVPKEQLKGAKTESINFDTVVFVSSSATIDSKYLPVIKKIADTVNQHGGGDIRIVADANDFELATKRAESVLNQLLAQVSEPAKSNMKVTVEKRTKDAIVSLSNQQVLLGTVLFAFNRAEVNEEYSKLLDQIALLIAKTGNGKVSIIGYTDAKGGYDYNLKLSKRRAATVYQELYRRLPKQIKQRLTVAVTNQ